MQKNIETILELNGYVNNVRLNRRKINTKNYKKNIKGTQEFFTPYDVVKKMCDKISDDDWKNPQKTFLEPSFGNGQFVVYIIWNRLQHGIDWQTALETLYGVELMQDNVYETHGRVIKLLDALGIDYDCDVAMDIMLRNLVCSDFFEWNFNEWRKYTEEELKLINKKHVIKHKNLIS